MASSSKPDWRDPFIGTRSRVALWLVETVREGGLFTKQQLRSAFPGVEQVDRRMRDLRAAGWVISTYRETAELKPNELRLDTIGEPVWEAGKRTAGLRPTSAQIRRMVLERDSHRCTRCGITAGEPYPEDPGSRARLTVTPLKPRTGEPTSLVTECARCSGTSGNPASRPSAEEVWDGISALAARDQVRLLAWMARDLRTPDPAEVAWAQYRQLPAVERQHVQDLLADALGRS